MKKQLNILLSFVLASVMLISTFSVANAYELKEKPEEGELVEILKRLDVIDESYDDLKDSFVTRGQFVKLALNAAGYDESWLHESSSQVFLDVFPDNDNYLYVNYAYESGIVNGSGDGCFLPDDDITFIEAIIIAMRTFGYKMPVEAVGGSESDYVYMAKKQGFLNEVDASFYEGISYKDAVRIIYNALNSNEVKSYNNGYYIDESKTYFNTIYNIYGFEGIVEKTSSGGLYESSSAEKGLVEVSGEKFIVGENEKEPYLGTRINIYYRIDEDKDEKVIVYFSEKKTSTVTVDLEDIKSISAYELQYWADGKVKKEKISAKAVTVINNVPTLFDAASYSLPLIGEITLVDSNDDKCFDVVRITDAELLVVSQADYLNREIFSKYQNVGKICIDDYETCVIFKKDGSLGELSDIAANDMLKVIKGADFERLEIHILTDIKQVTVSRLNQTAERTGVRFEIGSDMKEDFITAAAFNILEGKSPEIGVTYLFYFDEKGRIAAISSEIPDASYKYGYLINCDSVNNISDTVQVKIFTADGEFKIFDLRDKIAVSGQSKITSEAFKNSFDTPQLVRYSVDNDEKIKSIEYAAGNRDAEGFRILGKITETTTRDNTKYYKSSGLVGGRFAIAPKTRVFIVPPNDEINNEDKYYAYDYSYFGDQRFYPDSIGYGTAPESLEADVVVRKWSQTTINTDALVLLFYEFQEEFNFETGEYDNYLSGYLNGKLMQYKMAASLEKSYKTTNGDIIPVESGDCVRVAFNPEGEADTIKLIFDESERTIYGNSDTDDTTTRYGSQFRCIFGKFEKRYGNYYSFISFNETEPSEDVYNINASYVYIVDMSEKNERRFTVTDKNSITTLEENPSETMDTFVFYNYSTAKIAVMYK